MIKFKSLNRSQDFIKILKKKKLNTKYFTIYFDKNINKFYEKNIPTKPNCKKKKTWIQIQNEKNRRSKSSCKKTGKRKKKNIGNAVTRNKIKRKLKSAVQKVLKEKQAIDLNRTYVIFGKNNVYKDKFINVLNEVNVTFKKIKQMDAQI